MCGPCILHIEVNQAYLFTEVSIQIDAVSTTVFILVNLDGRQCCTQSTNEQGHFIVVLCCVVLCCVVLCCGDLALDRNTTPGVGDWGA